MAVLADHIADHGGEIGRLTPKLTARVGALAPVEALDPETTRQLLVEAVTDLMQRAARDRPLLLVLDDIQWADRNTMLLIRRLVRSSSSVPLMVIGTYRSANADRGELGGLLGQLRNMPTVTDLAVGGLSASELLALLEGAAGRALDHDGEAVAAYLLEETSGNPFFVAELLRHFVETGVLGTDASGTWRVEIDMATVAVPRTVRAVLQQRLGRLGDEAVRVLGVASVAGREFDSDLMAAVLGRDEMAVLDAIEAAVDASLVREVDVGRFEFTHALVQHTLYDGLGATRRGLHHRQLAVAIETGQGDEAPAGVVANHWASTGRDDRAKVAEWARRAGAAAIAALSPEDAVRWFRQALDAVGEDDHQRLDLLIELGDAQRWADTDAFRQTLLDAAALAERLGDDRALVRAALANNRGGASRAGMVDDQRVEVLERALAAAGPDDSSDRACLLATLAIELSQGGEWERRIALAEEAVACARGLGDELTLLRVLLLTTEATRLPTTLDRRLIDTEQLFSIAKRLGDPVLLGIAAVREVRVNIEAAAFDQVDEAMAVLDEVAHLDPYVRMNRLSLKAVLAQVAGDLPGALALAEEARVVGEAEPDALAVYVATAAQILWDMGALGTLLPMIEHTVRDQPGVTGFRAVLGIAYCDVDRLDEAAEILRYEVETGFAEHPFNPLWLITMSVVASLCIELGDREAAARLYEILQPWSGRANSSVVSINGLVSETLAGLALVAGDLERVELDVADALEQANRVGARVSATRTRLVHARLLAARHRPGDPEQALAEVRAVEAEAAAMGMATVRRRAASLAESIDTMRESDA
jgi:tetratricopeptide (TPR) repeat protein